MPKTLSTGNVRFIPQHRGLLERSEDGVLEEQLAKRRHINTLYHLDSIDTTKLPVQASTAENEIQQNHAVVVQDIENAATKRIQAVFRSYLARKALYALRGLVTVQELVRGYLDKMDMNLRDTQGVSKRKSGYLNPPQIEMIGGFTTYYSEDLSIRRQEHQYEEYSFTAHNSPQHYLATYELNPRRASSSTFQQPYCIDHMSQGYPFLLNYMANTEASGAKVRSPSEPKQRPNCGMRQKSRRMETTDGTSVPLDNQMQRSCSRSKRVDHANHDPWLLYQSTRSSNNRCDAITPRSGHSNHHKSLDAYELRNLLTSTCSPYPGCIIPFINEWCSPI